MAKQPTAEERQRGITRRMVLAGSAAVTLSGSLLAYNTYTRWWDIPHGADLKALSDLEYDVVQALAEAWMPGGDTPPDLSGRDANCGAFVDELVSRLPDEQRKLFKLMLHVIDDTPRLIDFQAYRDLPIDKRAGHLSVWLNSPIYYHRQGVSAVMALISFAYTTHPEVAPILGKYFGCGFSR